jgi:hypothetical protein
MKDKFNPLEMIQRAACVGLIQGSDYDCVNPLKSSVSERLLVGNLNDIETITYDVTNPAIITDIKMKLDTAMFAFTGVRSSVKPEIGFSADEFTVGFVHKVLFSVFEVDAASKNNLQAMASVKTFAIYQNPKDTSLNDAVWEVLGANTGLEMQDLSRMPQSKDGSYKLDLATSDTASETQLPNSFWDGISIASTEVLIDALLIPAI